MEFNAMEASAKECLAYYQAKLDEEAWEAKKNGKLVCWSASVAPPEFCVAMDIAMVYPETHAAGAGARKASMDLLEVADEKGYNIDICSYARTNLGYMELLKQEALTGQKPEKLANSKAAYVPLPDLVITCNNICNTLLKWYENLAVELDIPCIVIDVPFNHTMPIPEYAKAYIADQFRNAISQLEVICGRPFDWKKFKEVKDQTQRSVYHWNRIADMAQYKPSPLNGFDLFNYMALIVACRSLDYAEITFKAFADELEKSLKAVGMWQYREHSPNKLSGGQKQRVAIAGVMAMEPKCIILDEPTAMLDPNGRKEVLEAVHALNREKGVTIILITHYMEEVVDADYVYVMDQGKVVLEGNPRGIFSQVETLKEHRLDVPQITLLAHELQKAGLAIPDGILTREELIDALQKVADKRK